MKINYRLEVEYQVFEKEGKTYFETKNYVFNSNNSQINRRNVIDKYESYQHVFDIANKKTRHIKLSVTEVVNKTISDIKIPSLNIYYSTNEFDENNKGTVLFGSYLEDDFIEQLLELEEERNVYKYHNINEFETEMLFDLEGNSFKVIKEYDVFEYELLDPKKLKFSL